MSEESETPAKKTAKAPVQLACKVLIGGTKIGTHLKAAGARVTLPEADAEALEKRGSVKVLGVSTTPTT